MKYFSLLLFIPNLVLAEPINIGSRRELLVDQYLIESMSGDVQLQVQQPTPHEVSIVTDDPWEGNTCAYYTVFQDGDLYRMYYRGSHGDLKTQKSLHPEVTCYAESADGIHWTKPKLNLFAYEGSKENNIVWDGIGTHCFTPFKDPNPDCKPEARYKAISRGRPRGKKGLYVFQSPDGIHWSLIHDEPVITEGAFDSQNLAFWDPHRKNYVDFHRTFTNGVRSIMTCRSKDFVNWSEPELLNYPGAPNQHLYTNAIRSYHRAPHLLIGFPTRYLPKDSQVEPIFMSSRDGVTFQRYNDPVVPRDAPKDRMGNRSNYMINALVEIPSEPDHMSVYATEAYYEGPDTRVRRFSYRKDGFVALHSESKEGIMTTKPLAIPGSKLTINYRCQTGGSVRISLLDGSGKEVRRSENLTGDSIQQVVRWNSDQKSIPESPLRLQITLNRADLYAFQFIEE